MFFAIDVGNTQIVFGIYGNDGSLKNSWRVNSGTARTADEYAALVNNMIEFDNLRFSDISIFALSSVVPHITSKLVEMNNKYIKAELFQLQYSHLKDFSWDIENPAEVGADRLCNIAGGFYKYGGPLIVLDFGTAMTIDVVSEKAVYLGGSISPGLETIMSTLHHRAAKLPKVSFEFPEHSIGKNTVEHIQSGIMYGTAAMVDGMVKRAEEEIKSKAVVVATGGLAPVICRKTERVEHIDLDLTLDGLRSIYLKNH